MAESEVPLREFCSGLLLALRPYCPRFNTWGHGFHWAFYQVITRVREEGLPRVSGLRWVRWDPVFGVVPQANQMVLDAWGDRLIELQSPAYQVARFLVDEEEADQELEQLHGPSADLYRSLAESFSEHLS